MKSLKSFREAAGLSQFQLASAAGLGNAAVVSETENYKRPLSRGMAEKCAPVLGVTAGYLLANHTMAEVSAMGGQLEAALKSDGGDERQNEKAALEFVNYLISKAEDQELPAAVRDPLVKAARSIFRGLNESREAQESRENQGDRDAFGRKREPEKPMERDSLGRARKPKGR